MSALHIVNKSAFSSHALASCLRVVQAGDCILLMEDGVYSAMEPGRDWKYPEIKVCVLAEDLLARGLAGSSFPSWIESVSYAEFVTLTCVHERSVSWF